MITAIFYICFILYTWLFGWIFNLDFNSFNEPMFYVLGILTLFISFILSFATILAFTSILGEFRKGKPYTNKFNHYFAKSLLRLAIHIGRIKVTVTGKENIPEDNNFVFVANHQENYDIMILLPIIPNQIVFIAKKTLMKAPIIGKWIELLGNVPISRNADREAARSIITGIKRYKDGNPVGIFPEGKRAFGNEMIEFKAGALKLAMKPQADILIGTLYDMSTIFKRFPWRRYDTKVHFHPVLKHEEYKDLNSQELAQKIKDIIQAKLDEFEAEKNSKK